MTKEKDPTPDEQDAAKQEADPKPVTVDWNGRTWDLPPSLLDAPAAAVAALEQDKALTFVEMILGPKQWRRYAQGATTRDAIDFMNAIIRDGYSLTPGG